LLFVCLFVFLFCFLLSFLFFFFLIDMLLFFVVVVFGICCCSLLLLLLLLFCFVTNMNLLIRFQMPTLVSVPSLLTIRQSGANIFFFFFLRFCMTVFVEFLSSKPLLFLLPSGKEQSEEEGEEGEKRDEGRKKFSMSLDLNSTLSVKRHGFKFTLIKSKRFERERWRERSRERSGESLRLVRGIFFSWLCPNHRLSYRFTSAGQPAGSGSIPRKDCLGSREV